MNLHPAEREAERRIAEHEAQELRLDALKQANTTMQCAPYSSVDRSLAGLARDVVEMAAVYERYLAEGTAAPPDRAD